MSGKILFIPLIIIMIFLSCDVSDPFSTDELITTIQIQFSNLPPQENGYHYEGWAVIGNDDKSIGKFNINQDGEIVDIYGEVVDEGRIDTEFDMSQATLFKISIEEADDINFTPSGSFILAGPVTGFSVILNISHSEAIGQSYSTATAKYLLATPSTPDTLDEKSGIWFMDEEASIEPIPGIDAPDMVGGWYYQGWVTFGDTSLTTGKFDLVGAGDTYDMYTAVGSTPFLPGEDFVTNAPPGLTFPTDLSGLPVKITLESQKDDNKYKPSQFILFSGQVPEDAVKNVNYSLTNQSSTLPTGIIALIPGEENK
jgi:hypothetical protein